MNRVPRSAERKTTSSSSSSSSHERRIGSASFMDYDVHNNNQHHREYARAYNMAQPPQSMPLPPTQSRYYYNYYQAGGAGGSARYRPSSLPRQNEVIQVRLRDLIDPDRNRTFIDNLYAQFESNSNKINLIYVHPTLNTTAAASNSTRPLNNEALADTKLLNDFYMNAYIRNRGNQHNSKQNTFLFFPILKTFRDISLFHLIQVILV